MTTIIAAGTGKAEGNNAASGVFAKGLLHQGRLCVTLTLPIELTGTGQQAPGANTARRQKVKPGRRATARHAGNSQFSIYGRTPAQAGSADFLWLVINLKHSFRTLQKQGYLQGKSRRKILIATEVSTGEML